MIKIASGIFMKNAAGQSQISSIKLPHNGPITPPASAEAPINPKPYIQYFFSKIKETEAIAIGIIAPPPIA